jgi:hypothetical protein
VEDGHSGETESVGLQFSLFRRDSQAKPDRRIGFDIVSLSFERE